MGILKAHLIIAILLTAVCIAVLSCKTDTAALQIENSLPQSEIAYYNDSFEIMREDLWDRAGYLLKTEQMQNFLQVGIRFANGKLVIRTKTGSFSKGGFGSNFALRGDFDIQLDCRINFLKGISGMDQALNFYVLDKSGRIGKTNVVLTNVVFIELAMGGGSHQAWMQSHGFSNLRRNKSSAKKIENFDGTLRILRNGKNISTFYEVKGAIAWSKMHTFRVADNDMIVGFQVRNFFNKRTSIVAPHSISAEFDNFRINAAHDIIEDEI